MESWGGKGEGSVAASRHPSWDEEDDGGGGVWNSTGSQGSSSSFNSGGWGQTHGGKRGNIKVDKSGFGTHNMSMCPLFVHCFKTMQFLLCLVTFLNADNRLLFLIHVFVFLGGVFWAESNVIISFLKSGGGDSWMNPVSRQFSNMGLLVRLTKFIFLISSY